MHLQCHSQNSSCFDVTVALESPREIISFSEMPLGSLGLPSASTGISKDLGTETGSNSAGVGSFVEAG